jgi:hypothetical protein
VRISEINVGRDGKTEGKRERQADRQKGSESVREQSRKSLSVSMLLCLSTFDCLSIGLSVFVCLYICVSIYPCVSQYFIQTDGRTDRRAASRQIYRQTDSGKVQLKNNVSF